MATINNDNKISIDDLRGLLRVDEDGKLFWLVRKGRGRVGAEAGTIAGLGYRYLEINYISYRASRVVFALHNGRWPTGFIDHIDGDISNNKIGNLREVTRRQNNQNRKTHREGRLQGTTFCKRKQKWRAQITDRKAKSLGYFSSEVEAHHAYIKYLEKLGERLP